MSKEHSELRRLLVEIWNTSSQDRRNEIRRIFEAALPTLLDENIQLRERLVAEATEIQKLVERLQLVEDENSRLTKTVK